MIVVKKVVLGILLYLLFMLVLFPARLALGLAPLPKDVSVEGVSGSLWQGEASSVAFQGRQVDQVRWSLSPWALLLGSANLELQVGNRRSAVTANGELSLSMSGVGAHNFKVSAPHDFLIGNRRLPFGAEVSGNLELYLANFKQGSPWCEQLTGKLNIQGAGLKNQFGEYDLGNMGFGLGCIEGRILLKADEKDNQLGLVGALELQADNKLLVKAKIRETDFQNEDMKKALAFLGRKDAEGYYPLEYQGKIPGL
ncbi:type II secretion system protein N [Shewanella sedimentimangrovi]|uniref:Type II secretion system protein N n=2 Tax=Shewanella sedimentimangrovi TaxID=2814293 RepID=A0ABX7R1T8_9GAMM|nr:type II secretion system protein N [Shewanella sedimentimangrovi]QSX37444.1 type II secretion system protein N [Shewanella sedimentimangrovi]